MYFVDSRRKFLKDAAFGAAALGLASTAGAAETARTVDKPKVQGFEEQAVSQFSRPWKPVSDRKIRVGIVGYGFCRFGAQFYFQDHPNVEVVAVSDLFPDRCRNLARDCRCERTYPSLEEMVKDDSIEAIFVATDAPSHCQHVIEVLKHGKHAACAVPAVFGSMEDAERLFEAVKQSGRNYMMFETSYYHDDVYAMRQIYRAGGFGKLVYTEGEYFHDFTDQSLPSYKNWRDGLPPQYYPTHSNGYYVGVSGGSFTEVSCLGMPCGYSAFGVDKNAYKNPFGTEIAQMRTSEGGMARMAVSWDTPGLGGETGRVRGKKGSMTGLLYEGLVFENEREAQARLAREKAQAAAATTGTPAPTIVKAKLPDLRKPGLPPGVHPGGHGGSHGYLCNEFVTSILENRRSEIDIDKALNMTVAGIVAHQSALKDGELMKIPQYKLV